MDAHDASPQDQHHGYVSSAGGPATVCPGLVIQWVTLWAALVAYERIEPVGLHPTEVACLAFAACLGLLPPEHVPSVELRLLEIRCDIPWRSVVNMRAAAALTFRQLLQTITGSWESER